MKQLIIVSISVGSYKARNSSLLFTKMLHGQDDNIEDSIRMLSKLLYKHYDQKAVILIDEYDVPLDKAFQNGYYKEMVSLIRALFGQALDRRAHV